MLNAKWFTLTLLFLSSMAFAESSSVEVFEMPAKMKGDTNVCAAGPSPFVGSPHLIEAYENKIKQGFEAVTGYWRNYEQQTIRNRTSVYCIRVRPIAPKKTSDASYDQPVYTATVPSNSRTDQ